MRQLATNNADFNLSSEIEVFSFALAAGPDGYDLKAEVRAGDGTKDIAGNGAYRVRATVAGVEVFRSDVVVATGVVRRIFDVEVFGRASEEVKIFLTGLAADTDVDVTTYLYTGVDVSEISGDETAADYLESFLNGDGVGVILRAEQLKLACAVAGEGALDCRNSAEGGLGQRNDGVCAGQLNTSDDIGQSNIGLVAGQSNLGVGEGKSLMLIGPADLLDAILADTDELQGDWADGGRLDLLIDLILEDTAALEPRLTAIRAGYLDELGPTNIPADLDAVLADTAAVQSKLPSKAYLRGTVDADGGMDTEDKADVNAEADQAFADYDGPTKAEMDTAHGLLATPAEVAAAESNIRGADSDDLKALSDQADAIKAKADTIGAVDTTYTSPAVGADGPFEIHCGSAYLAADGRALTVTITGYGGPSLAGGAAKFRLLEKHKWAHDETEADLENAGTVAQDGTTVTLTADLTVADTLAMAPSPPRDIKNYRYQFVVTPDGGDPFVLADGDLTAKKGIEAASA